MMSRGVDFNNQFDFSNTHAPYLLDQRHRLSIAAVYAPGFGAGVQDGFLRSASVGLDAEHGDAVCFGSSVCGADRCRLHYRGCTALDPTTFCRTRYGNPASNSINNTAAFQATANSALGINSGSPSPFVGLDSFYGPWTEQVDLGLARRFKVTERHAVSLQAQVFNVMNHANYYVQNGTGVNYIQYSPFGQTCGDGATRKSAVLHLVPTRGFGTLQNINYQNGPRIMQFSLKWTF